MNITKNVFFYLCTDVLCLPIISKSTRVGKRPAMVIDQIIIDHVLTCDFKTAILKSDLTDHFPIVIALKYVEPSQQH